MSSETTIDNDKQLVPRFDWAIYADATFAGLSVLIPVPLLDLAFEWLFRRRMPGSIAKRNSSSLHPVLRQEINRSPLACSGCLTWPILLTLEFLKRLYRTVFYFLTVKAATDQLSYYWHRAFLLNHMMQQGHLDMVTTGKTAIAVMNEVIAQANTSPVMKLAEQIIGGVSHILRTIWGWVRRRQEDEVVTATKEQMARSWGDLQGYFQDIATTYDSAYEKALIEAETAVKSQASSPDQSTSQNIRTNTPKEV